MKLDPGDSRFVLVGRNAELDALAEHLADDRSFVLLGEAGIGKTALLRAAAAASGRSVCEGGGLSMLSWMPFLPVLRAIGQVAEAGDAAWVAAEVERIVGDGVLLLDDLQWADDATLGLLAELAGSVMLAGAVRRGDPGTEAALAAIEAAGITVAAVEPLDAESAAALVLRARPDLSASAVARLVERAGRNPLLLEELAVTGEPSASLRLALAARLRDAGDARDARDALALLSLAGRPLPTSTLGPTVPRLVAAGLALVEGDLVAVRHSLLGEVIVESIAPDERVALHARLARIVDEPGEAARHHAAAGEVDLATAKAMEAVDKASRPGERAAHLELAASLAEGPDADVLRLDAVEALLDAREAGPAPGRLLAAITTDDPQLVGRACTLRWWYAYLTGDPDGMRAAVRDGLAAVGGSGTVLDVRLRVLDARVAVAVEEFGHETLPRVAAALDLARSTGVDVALAEATMGAAHYLAGSPAWREHMDAALREAVAAGDLGMEMLAAQNTIAFHESAGVPADGRRLAATMAQRARDLRLRGWERHFTFERVNLDMHAGDYPSAIDGAHALLGEPLDLRTRQRVLQALLPSLIDVGRLKEADQRIDDALEWASPDKQGRWWFLYFRADAALWAGRPQQAVVAADEALAWPALEDPLASFALVVRAWACLDLGTAPLDRQASSGGMPMLAGAPAECAGVAALAAGEPERAAGLFDEAAGGWAGYHRRGELRSRWGAGEARRRAGDLDGARSVLLAVERDATAAGMAPLLGRVQHSLRRAGVRRTATRGASDLHGLTPREREVLSLVSEGLRTIEIARRLGVSRSTIAAQLASVSSKVGATNTRSAAARIGGS